MPNYTTPMYFEKSSAGNGGVFVAYASSLSFLTQQLTTEDDTTRRTNSPVIPQDNTHWAWTYPKGVVWIRPGTYNTYTLSNLGVWMESMPTGTQVFVGTNAYGTASAQMDLSPLLQSNSSNSYGGLTIAAIYPAYSTSTNNFRVNTSIASSGIGVPASSSFLLMTLRVDSAATPGDWSGTMYYTYTVS